MADEPGTGSLRSINALDVPCLVYSADAIVKQYASLHAFLDVAYPNTQIFYAAKACYCPPVIELLMNLGCGLELLSRDEHRIASALGVTGSSIVWNGCALGDDILLGAISRGERLNIDSPSQFFKLNRIAASHRIIPEVGLRINVDGTGKLGMEYADVVDLIRSGSAARIIGLHFHESPKSAGDADNVLARRLEFLEIAHRLEKEEDLTLEYVDVGGGLLADLAVGQQLSKVTKAMKALRSEPALFLEPGAYFVETAGTALTRVVATKCIGNTKWATVDIGMNVLVPLNRARFTVSGGRTSSGPATPINIAGAFGVTSDVVALNQNVSVEEGDVLRVERCGAYTESMRSCMITEPPPIYWHTNGRYERVTGGQAVGSLFLDYHGYTGRAVMRACEQQGGEQE